MASDCGFGLIVLDFLITCTISKASHSHSLRSITMAILCFERHEIIEALSGSGAVWILTRIIAHQSWVNHIDYLLFQ